jgi:hypothetical protein
MDELPNHCPKVVDLNGSCQSRFGTGFPIRRLLFFDTFDLFAQALDLICGFALKTLASWA